MKKFVLWRGIAAALALILTVSLFMSYVAFDNAGSINAVLGIESGSVALNDNMVYESSYGPLSDENLAKLVADEAAFAVREMEEGAVLFENDGALPLASGIKNITLFGRASADPVYKSHAGGGIVSAETAVSLKSALEAAGFNINETLYNAYANSSTSRVKGNQTTTKSEIGEESIDFYTSEIRDSFNDYKDAAIVVLSRDSGEGQDFDTVDAEGIPQLALHQAEKDMLKMIKDEGFQTIIVLINSGNAMELSWLDDAEYGVNACMWIGQPGRYGFPGVVNLLTGAATPSGHLVDTYAVDSLSSPAMMNWGGFTFTGSVEDAMSATYLVYQEGIYVGYKYYETRYEDAILGQGNATGTAGVYASSGGWNYAEEMSYPFGYGLSYTTFRQTLDDFTYDAASDEFVATVTVTNTGDTYSGKSVAQIYLQSPYTDYDKANGIEKAAVQIVGFGKTEELAPGASQTLEIRIDRYYTASYDSKGAKTYILDAGTYYFGLGDNAHDALNNILAKKGATGMYDIDGTPVSGDASKVGTYEVADLDTTTYSVSAVTGNDVTNQFTGDYAVDVNEFYDDDVVTYLSRSDWEGTYPQGVELEINNAIKSAQVSRTYTQSNTDHLTDDMINGKTGEQVITFADMYGVDYDDSKWEAFLDQLSISDMSIVISDTLGQGAVQTVSKPANKNADGPDGYGMAYRYGDQDSPTCYVIQNLAASTWSIDVMSTLGSFYGEDCIYARGQMAFAPGLDIHRTPYGGRNFEYSSEDGLFTGIMNSAEVAAMNEKGVIAGPKHLFANDQEQNRSGVCTFMTEQTARESGLKAFELCFTKGNARGSMLAMCRIGVKMSPVAQTLIRGIMMGEWGFNGILITDSSGSENDRIPTADSLIAGTSMFCLARRSSTMESLVVDNDDTYLYEVLREVNHRYYYNYVNSTLINGLTAGETITVTDTFAWWQAAIVCADIGLGLCTAAALILFAVKAYGKKKTA